MKKLRARLFPEGLTSSSAGFAGMTLVKILGGLVVIKLVAVHLGPQGLGQFGQLMSFVAIISIFAGGGITNGLIQSLASARDADERQRRLTAGVKIYAVEAVSVALLLLCFAPTLARLLMGDPGMAWVFWMLAFTQVIVGAGNVLQAVFSVMRRTGALALGNVLGTILGVAVFALLIAQQKQAGAAPGLILLAAAPAFISCIVAWFMVPPDWRKLRGAADRDAMRSLLTYVLTMLVMVAAPNLTQMILRTMVGQQVGWEYVGYWQGLLKISDGYMQLIGMVLVYYALPRFSAQQHRASLDKEFSILRLPIMAGMMVGVLVLFLLRDFIIHILFTPEFMPARDYFLPQIINDLLRTAAVMYVYYALARGARLIPILFELMLAGSTLVLAVLLLPSLQGLTPVYAQMAGSFVTLMFMAILHMTVTRQRFFTEENA